MVTAGAALGLACLAFLSYDLMVFRSAMRNDLSVLARITGGNSTAALCFGDEKAAQEILGALKAKTHIVEAAMYNSSGGLLAVYTRSNRSADFHPPRLQSEGISFAS